MEDMTGHSSNLVMSRRARVKRQIMSSDSVPSCLSRKKIVCGCLWIMTLRNFVRPKRRNEEKYFNSSYARYDNRQEIF